MGLYGALEIKRLVYFSLNNNSHFNSADYHFFLSSTARLIDPLPQPVDQNSLHEDFAESWRVDDPQGWLFGDFLSDMIRSEIESGPMTYNYSVTYSDVLEAFEGVCFRSFKLYSYMKQMDPVAW